ncbi:MAG: crotonobetainyl-CoA--carnitine CoA-transferase [Patescibacteria group bacterium]
MPNKNKIIILRHESDREKEIRANFVKLLKRTPIPDNEILQNIGLYANRKILSRILYLHDLYRQIINVHGVILDFGTRWGQNLALFESFRGMYEPYNYTRQMIGFDTFTGHSSIDAKDGSIVAEEGSLGCAVGTGYESYLEKVLQYHEEESPISHLKKFKLIKGDAIKTVPDYFKKHPETIVALAYFDFGLYRPTKVCLKTILPHLTKGSIIAFDELGKREYPGETLAVKEILNLKQYQLRRSAINSYQSYIVV